MERCRARLSFILAELIKTAKQTPKAEFDDPAKNKELPFGFAWWVFFIKMTLEKVLDKMMASLSNTAKMILGGSLDNKELLLLPGKWEGCKLWGVYTDIFKAARYCGSGTSKDGVAIRMDKYPAVHNGTRKAEKGAHSDLLMREQPNLRLIAVFDPSATPKPYVLLMEQLLSILLQILNVGTTHRYMRASTIAMIRRATQRDNDFKSPRDNDFESPRDNDFESGPRDNDFESKEVRRLNNAAQCLQGLYYTRRGSTVCANENCGTTESRQWCSADPGVPFSRVICFACYVYRREHNGEERPAKLAARPMKVHRTDLAKQAGPKPTGKSPCPGCGKTDVAGHKWQLPKGDFYQPGRTAWECGTCYRKPASALPVNGGKNRVMRSGLSAEIGPKPPAGAPCVGCGHPSNQWKIPKGDLVLEPGRKRYECQGCFVKPTSALPVNGGKQRAKRTTS